jgi:hypothetical protein
MLTVNQFRNHSRSRLRIKLGDYESVKLSDLSEQSARRSYTILQRYVVDYEMDALVLGSFDSAYCKSTRCDLSKLWNIVAKT